MIGNLIELRQTIESEIIIWVLIYWKNEKLITCSSTYKSLKYSLVKRFQQFTSEWKLPWKLVTRKSFIKDRIEGKAENQCEQWTLSTINFIEQIYSTLKSLDSGSQHRWVRFLDQAICRLLYDQSSDKCLAPLLLHRLCRIRTLRMHLIKRF